MKLEKTADRAPLKGYTSRQHDYFDDNWCALDEVNDDVYRCTDTLNSHITKLLCIN